MDLRTLGLFGARRGRCHAGDLGTGERVSTDAVADSAGGGASTMVACGVS